MNITITQDNSRVEVLGSNGASIIDKLYLLAIDPNNTLTLEGNISSTGAYGFLVDYLNTNYGPDLIVNATNKWILFEDPNVESYLASMNIGTDGKVSEALAAAVTSIASAANTTITKFNELRYFTNITEGKGGWTGMSTGNAQFLYWTSLEEIDISNFTSVGHDGFPGIEETFRGCSALRKVTASSNLFGIGRCAFSNCANLEEISGLSGTITMFEGAFEECTKLTSDNFEHCSGFYFDISGSNAFSRCTSLTTLPPLSGNLGTSTCQGCSNLETIDLTGAATIGNNAFLDCAKLNCTISCPNLTGRLGQLVFRNTKITRVLNLGSCTSVGLACFAECRSLTEVILPSTCTLLEEGVFYNSTNLLSVNIENIVTLGRTVFGASSEYSFNGGLLYFKELCTIEQDGTSNNGLFETGCLYIYAPKLQACSGGFDAGSHEVRGLFVCNRNSNRMTDHNIVYFKNLSSVETGAFCGGNIRNLVINNVTPPTVTAHVDQKQNLLIDVSGNGVSRSVVQNVWVPDSAVNTYKADTYWGEFGNKIQGLSGLSKVATRVLWDLLSDSAKADTLIEEYM